MTFQPPRAELAPYVDKARAAHADYVEQVSHDRMAASLRTSGYLWWLCDHLHAKKVCDLGSGFSSWVLRQTGAEVHSVDHSPEWLEITRGWVGGDGYYTVDEWVTMPDRYQVIFHDLASGTERDAVTAAAVDRLALFGVVVFDDAHHGDHHAHAAEVCADRGLPLLDLWLQTTDEYGRHAIAGVNQ